MYKTLGVLLLLSKYFLPTQSTMNNTKSVDKNKTALFSPPCIHVPGIYMGNQSFLTQKLDLSGCSHGIGNPFHV